MSASIPGHRVALATKLLGPLYVCGGRTFHPSGADGNPYVNVDIEAEKNELENISGQQDLQPGRLNTGLVHSPSSQDLFLAGLCPPDERWEPVRASRGRCPRGRQQHNVSMTPGVDPELSLSFQDLSVTGESPSPAQYGQPEQPRATRASRRGRGRSGIQRYDVGVPPSRTTSTTTIYPHDVDVQPSRTISTTTIGRGNQSDVADSIL